MPPSLPLELILLILEGDFNYSKCTLSATSLVCSIWRSISQRILFKTLTFRSHGKGRARASSTIGRAPIQSILRAPHLLRYARAVAIEDASCVVAGGNRGWMTSDHQGVYFWLRDDPLIPKVLGGLFHLGRIEQFSFICHSEAEYLFEEAVSAATMQVIFAICRSPRLKSLTLKGVPIELARLASPALRLLCVERGIIGEREEGGLGLAPSPQMRLGALTVNASCDHFIREVHWLRKHPNTFENLATLQVTLGDLTLGDGPNILFHDSMDQLLSLCRSIHSLNLDLSLRYGERKLRGLQNAALLHNLEDLKISFSSSGQERFVVPWITDFLMTLPHGNNLQTLSLYIRLLEFQEEIWEALDILLADKKRFPVLHIVSLHIMMGSTQWIYTTDGDVGVRLPLPMCNSLMQIREAMEWTKRHWSAHTKAPMT